jgi:hypothetical protein
VLGADTDTDEARAKPTRKRRAFEQPKGPGRPCSSGLTDVSADLFPKHFLQTLRDARGECAAALYFGEITGAHGAFPKGSCQYVGRSDSVLDSKIDSDAAHRRHGVRRVADAQQAGAIPLP